MRVVYFGTPDFAVSSLDAICHSSHNVVGVVTVPDRQAGRGQRTVFSPVKQYAIDHNLLLLQPEKLRNEQFLTDLAALQADIFVVVAFRMLPEVVWAMPKHGTFNLHASLLPRYRGAAPINWAIINGEKETGVTTFRLTHQIDEGDILLQEKTPISDNETAETLHDRLAKMGKELVVRTLNGLADSTISPKQQEGNPCPAPKLFKEGCMIDFNRSGAEVERLVRGLCPYPAASLTMINTEGQEVSFKIFSVVHEYTSKNEYGSMFCDGKKVLKFGVTDGFVEISELQMAGKKKNSIENFLRGNSLSDWELKYS